MSGFYSPPNDAAQAQSDFLAVVYAQAANIFDQALIEGENKVIWIGKSTMGVDARKFADDAYEAFLSELLAKHDAAWSR